MSYLKLRVPQHVYDRRVQRMGKMIRMGAPPILIYHEARLILKAYCPSLWHRFTWWLSSTRVGMWWLLLGYAPPILDEDESTEDDLQDPDFLLACTPDQLRRFVEDIAKAEPISYDSETGDRVISRAPQKVADCGCPIFHDGIGPIHGVQCTRS
jgi:hypothetical protein